jgi:hypothetical protein
MDNQNILESVSRWVENLVIGLNLCPFARREFENGRVRFAVSAANNGEQLLNDLGEEMRRLDEDASIETTLLIHPGVLTDFFEFNDFLDYTDRLLVQLDRDGVYQIASFHPDYQFAGTTANDVSNYTNRSPFPILHLLREDSLDKALAGYPNPAKIPENNIELMTTLGMDKVRILFQSCLIQSSPQT